MRAVLPFKPRPLLEGDFKSYKQSWDDLIAVAPTNPNALALLQKCFTSSNGFAINYAYLNEDVLAPLLKNAVPGKEFIKAKFVLVPGKTPDDIPVFSLALYRTKLDGTFVPNPEAADYYLAGVAALPARLGIVPNQQAAPNPEPTPPGYVPTATAEQWIRRWHDYQPGDIPAQLFDAQTWENGPFDTYLKGYTFMVTDFTIPWAQYPIVGDALWLNFDAKPRNPAAPDGPFVFSTIVDINTTPASGESGTLVLQRQVGAEAFYDISKPCPPYTC